MAFGPLFPHSEMFQGCVRYGTGILGTGIDVPNLPKCPVPVLMAYRTYRSVRYRYCCRSGLTEVSDTGTDVVQNLPKCPVPVRPAVYTGGICLGTYRAELTLLCMLFKMYPLDYQLNKSEK